MASSGRGRRPTGAIIAVLSLAGTTVSLQQTLVVALLPSFSALFGISPDDVSWLITATTSCRESSRAARDGTAAAGVPAKTMRRGSCLPIGVGQLPTSTQRSRSTAR